MVIPVQHLGQSGFRLQFGETALYIDPYLTDSVAESDGADMRRMVSSPISPDCVNDADWVLITHIHQDHCDLHTLIPLSKASPKCQFICPNQVATLLQGNGVEDARIIIAKEGWIDITSSLRIHPVPASHPTIERDSKGLLRCLGYVVDWGGVRIYHAGDTSPEASLIKILQGLSIDIAMLPVNERNFYRERRGIIGNMSVREAFQFAQDINAKKVIPTHWDMFSPNAVYEDEIKLLYKLISPPFELLMDPKEI